MKKKNMVRLVIILLVILVLTTLILSTDIRRGSNSIMVMTTIGNRQLLFLRRTYSGTLVPVPNASDPLIGLRWCTLTADAEDEGAEARVYWDCKLLIK